MRRLFKVSALVIAALLLNIASQPFQYIQNNNKSIHAWAQELDGSSPQVHGRLPKLRPRESVYVGGMPIGLEFKTRGLIIIGKTDVVTEDGPANPTKHSDIQVGDILMSVEGMEVNTADELSQMLNREEFKGRELSVEIRRKGQTIMTKILPAKDASTELYKTGLWVRQDTYGVGTLTFIRKDKRFASLGHPVVDSDTKDILLIKGGKALPCSIAGCVKGERGKPGEIKGLIMKGNEPIGEIDKNGTFGVYGSLNEIIPNKLYPEPIEIMPRSLIKPGKAYILTTLSGSQPQKFEIQIVKTNFQAKPCDRSIVIKVTDKRLLSVTGGIVQGMSGSPIIQNDKLCGAVTHVFVNDPTRGYGLYADWMIEQ